MASPPPNLDSRELPYGWTQQYNWQYKQWFYVNTREQPPRSSWEHPLGPMPQGFSPPLNPPPPDRTYSRSPYGAPPPPQGYGGYQSYQHPPQGYYNAPQGGYVGGPQHYGHENRGFVHQPQVLYEEERKHHKKGPGMGTALLAGGAGLVGGALLTEAFEHHEEREREEAFEEGYAEGFGEGYVDGGDGGDGGDWF